MTESRSPNFSQILTEKSLHRRTLALEHDRNSRHRQILILPPKNMLVRSAWTLLLYKKKKHQARRLGGPQI